MAKATFKSPFSERSVCLLWDGATNNLGYGVCWCNGKQEYAHRLAAGAKPGEVVIHTCDTPNCINPAHLRIGTHAENSADMVAKGRQARGERCGNVKLTAHEVRAIRALKSAATSRSVAGMFNVSKTNVLDIWSRRTWRHI